MENSSGGGGAGAAAWRAAAVSPGPRMPKDAQLSRHTCVVPGTGRPFSDASAPAAASRSANSTNP